jgi:signal peptide peptidase SppA
MYTAPKYWLGTEESGDSLLAAIEQSVAAQARGMAMEADGPLLLDVQQGVGVVSIRGPLIQGSAGMMAYFGVTGYDDVREAVAQAVMSPEVKTIMLHVASGGGQVAGVEDLGTFLKMAAKIKPMTTYADGVMTSAAYWLGSYGQHISTNRTTILGSLGVLMLHTDRSAQDANDGKVVTVIRSGKYKALANSSEPLSDVAKAELQGQADGIYSVFMDVIGANLGMSALDADTKIGQGREFLGKDAVKSGLADALMTYEQALMYSKSLDKTLQTNNNSGKSKGASAMKVTLSAEQLAAHASGATLQELGFSAEAVLETLVEKDGVHTDPALVKTEAAAPAVTVIADVTALAMSAELIGANAQISLLTAQLVTATQTLADKTAEIVAFKSQLEAASSMPALTEIARKATANMLIPLGGSAESVSQMSVTDLVAKHAEVSEIFKTKIRVGGVAQSAKVEAEAALKNPWLQTLVGAAPQAKQAALLARK